MFEKDFPSTECSETRPGGSPPGRSESVDKADAWDAVAAKNAEITALRAENERLSNITHEVRDNPEKIWLEPGCSPERCWSETRLDDCEEHGCGAKAVAYVREDIVDTLRSVSNALGEQLAMMIDNAGNVANLRAKLERLCDAAQAVIRVADRSTIEFDGLKAAIASAHTHDMRAHSAFANSENVRRGEWTGEGEP